MVVRHLRTIRPSVTELFVQLPNSDLNNRQKVQYMPTVHGQNQSEVKIGRYSDPLYLIVLGLNYNFDQLNMSFKFLE